LPAWAGGQADLGRQHLIRLFVFGAFWAAAKCAKTLLRPQPRKNLFINKESFFNVGSGKIFKRWFLLGFVRSRL
jgi:hypothetical protein